MIYAVTNLLSTLDTLTNWTDGRILCRHSVPAPFLVFIMTVELRAVFGPEVKALAKTACYGVM